MPIPALFLLFAAQSLTAQPQPATGAVSHHRGIPFISPMGEPFRAGAGGDGLVDWFRQADLNHDGTLTADEMEQDAARFFVTLDSNHDGEIDPDEITHYETVLAPEIDTGPGARLARAQAQQRRSGGGRGGSRHHGGGGIGGYGAASEGDSGLADDLDNPIGGGRFGLLNIPEPVSSADADFNRGVSLSEFKQAAHRRFQLLDTNHAGRLALAQLQEQRRATLAAVRRPHGPSAAASESDSENSMPY
jgi:Ca2+-binding EF-hand superfamily protein